MTTDWRCDQTDIAVTSNANVQFDDNKQHGRLSDK